MQQSIGWNTTLRTLRRERAGSASVVSISPPWSVGNPSNDTGHPHIVPCGVARCHMMLTLKQNNSTNGAQTEKVISTKG